MFWARDALYLCLTGLAVLIATSRSMTCIGPLSDSSFCSAWGNLRLEVSLDHRVTFPDTLLRDEFDADQVVLDGVTSMAAFDEALYGYVLTAFGRNFDGCAEDAEVKGLMSLYCGMVVKFASEACAEGDETLQKKGVMRCNEYAESVGSVYTERCPSPLPGRVNRAATICERLGDEAGVDTEDSERQRCGSHRRDVYCDEACSEGSRRADCAGGNDGVAGNTQGNHDQQAGTGPEDTPANTDGGGADETPPTSDAGGGANSGPSTAGTPDQAPPSSTGPDPTAGAEPAGSSSTTSLEDRPRDTASAPSPVDPTPTLREDDPDPVVPTIPELALDLIQNPIVITALCVLGAFLSFCVMVRCCCMRGCRPTTSKARGKGDAGGSKKWYVSRSAGLDVERGYGEERRGKWKRHHHHRHHHHHQHHRGREELKSSRDQRQASHHHTPPTDRLKGHNHHRRHHQRSPLSPIPHPDPPLSSTSDPSSVSDGSPGASVSSCSARSSLTDVSRRR